MKNLAGDKEADVQIREELYLANIPKISVDIGKSEVPYHYIGKIGKWTFKRAWYYWVVSVEETEDGLPLEIAMKLFHAKHPTKIADLGSVIRSGGHGGALPPNEYGADPVYNDELDNKLVAAGYKKEYNDFLKKEYVSINVGELSKAINEGKVNTERYVTIYHVDDIVGLCELVKTIKEYIK